MTRIVDIHGQARHVDGEPVGEIFVDTADGPTMAVVVRRGEDGQLLVEIHKPGESLMVDILIVSVNDERVYETLH